MSNVKPKWERWKESTWQESINYGKLSFKVKNSESIQNANATTSGKLTSFPNEETVSQCWYDFFFG